MHNPGAVAWYCALKLEMAVELTKALLTAQLRSDVVPGRATAQAKLAEELSKRMGVDVLDDDIPDLQHYGRVDDHYASFEWSEGV